MKRPLVGLAFVFAALSLSTVHAQNAEKISINVCGGGTSGTYIKVAKYLKYMLEGGGQSPFQVNVLETNGSQENIAAVNDGRCSVAVLQNDADEWFKSQQAMNPVELRTVAKIYNEQAHLVCDRSLEINSFADLEGAAENAKATIFVSENSGSEMMIQNLINFYPNDYAGINLVPVGKEKVGPKSYDATQNSIRLAEQGNACAFFVTRAPYQALLNMEPAITENLNLVALSDRKFNNLKDKDNEEIYSFIKFGDIAGDAYAALRKLSWRSSASDTLQVSANLVANKTWEADMLSTLENQGLTGTAARWKSTLQKVQKFSGDFNQIDALLKNLTSTPLPAPAN